MKIYLTSAYKNHQWLDLLNSYASNDKIGRHQLAATAEEADAILFVENAQFKDYTFRKVRQHPLISRYAGKVFLYNEVDKPFCRIPGLYCSMPSTRFRPDRQEAFPYLALPNQYVQHIHNWKVRQDYPFAFVGSISHRLRKRVIALRSQSPGIVDTSEFNVWDATQEERASQGMRFAEAMARSKFILCPRGIGTSSYRQFEAMQAARAPVIISDKWVAPPQVDWSFAINIPESDIEGIPDILAGYESEAEDRGRAARQVWETAYAPDVLFDTTAESVARLLKKQKRLELSGHSVQQLFPEFAPIKEWLTEIEVAARTTAQTYRQAWG